MEKIPNQESNMATTEHLRNMVNMMSRSIGDYASLERLSIESDKFGKRRRAVQWMKEVATGFRISSDARDSGIQIFDKFYALILSESDSEKLSQHSAKSTQVNKENLLLNCGLQKVLSEEYSEPDSQLNPNIVSYAAAVSIILGSKLHESNGELTLGSFQDFEIESLKYFERFVLEKLLFSISPQVTPFAFIRKFLKVWQPENDNMELSRIADNLVAAFWEETTSMLFAPSTIAIAALILSFSILRQDCTDWLSSIPNFCLPLLDNTLTQNPEGSHSYLHRAHKNFHLFDIDRCLKSFKPVEAKYSKRIFKVEQTISPTSIANFPSQEATPMKSNRGPIESACDSRNVKYGRDNHFERVFGEIDFDAAFTTSHGQVMSVPVKGTQQLGASSKKRSFSMSCLAAEKQEGQFNTCLAGDLEMYMTSSNYSNAIYHGKRSRSNSFVQPDSIIDQANAEWDRNLKQDKKHDGHRTKKQCISSEDGRSVTNTEIKSNPSSRSSSCSNKYATVGLDIDCISYIAETKILEDISPPLSSSSSSLPPCTPLIDLL